MCGPAWAKAPQRTSLESRRDLLRVLLMTLEDLQASREQVLQLGIAGARNKCVLKSVIHRLMIGDFVIDVSFIEGGTVELGEFGTLVGGLLAERLAGVIVFGSGI